MTPAGDAAGIWATPELAAAGVPPALQATLGEAQTPRRNAPGVSWLWLQREDANPTGSHKDRAACFQVARAAAGGAPAVVISSSGNAGIATSRYAEAHGIPAIVCVHPDTDPAKLAAIDGATTTVVITERAINAARRISVALRAPNLRPSRDDDAVLAYRSLGHELAAFGADDVFLFATSGATVLAVAGVMADSSVRTRVHLVQGAGNAALAHPEVSPEAADARAAAAGRLGVRNSARVDDVRAAIHATGGSFHVVDTPAVSAAQQQLENWNIPASRESSANLAAASAAHDAGDLGERVVVVVSGAPPAVRGRHAAATLVAADEWEALEAIDPAAAATARKRLAGRTAARGR